MIRGLVRALYCNGYAAQLARNLSGNAPRARIAFDRKNHAFEIRQRASAERLHRVKRASRSAAACESGAGRCDPAHRSCATPLCRGIPCRRSRASSADTAAIALSGVATRITSASNTSRVSPACGVPPPIARTAAREVAVDRVTTAPMRHPSSRRRLPSVLPTRPAPTMEIVRAMQRDSITCSHFLRGKEILRCTISVLLLWAGLRWCGFLWPSTWRSGVPQIPTLPTVRLCKDADCPRISILFAARDEAEKLPAALSTLLALDYPHYEVIAVDDRSEDETGKILAAAAAKHSRLKVVRVDSLPDGLARETARACSRLTRSRTANGLCSRTRMFHFAPDLLRRALALARKRSGITCRCWATSKCRP